MPEKTYTSLTELTDDICQCVHCGLRPGCNRVVPGEGSASATVMFVGEAPGENEDLEGRPFCGRVGDVLRIELLRNALDAGKYYITNTARCRPPNHRAPNPDEADACWPWTEATL